MDNEKDKLEGLFKKRFENEELPVPEGMWERMRPVLPPPPASSGQKTDGGSGAAQATPWAKIISAFIVATFLSVTTIYLVTKKKITNSGSEKNTVSIEIPKETNTADASGYSGEDENMEHYSSDPSGVNANDLEENRKSFSSSSDDPSDFIQSSDTHSTLKNSRPTSDADNNNGTPAYANTKSGKERKTAHTTSTPGNSNPDLSKNFNVGKNPSGKRLSATTPKHQTNNTRNSDDSSVQQTDSFYNSKGKTKQDDSRSGTSAHNQALESNTSRMASNGIASKSNTNSTNAVDRKEHNNPLLTNSTDTLAHTATASPSDHDAAVSDATSGNDNTLADNTGINGSSANTPNRITSLHNDSKTSDTTILTTASDNSGLEATGVNKNTTNDSGIRMNTSDVTTDQNVSAGNTKTHVNGKDSSSKTTISDLLSENKNTIDQTNTTSFHSSDTSVGNPLISKITSADSIAVVDSISKEEKVTTQSPDSSATRKEKAKQWRGNWIVEMNAGPSLFQKNTTALSNSSGLSFEPSKTNPGMSLQLDVFRTLKNNFMLGAGISYQRNAYTYSASQNRDEQYTFGVDSSYEKEVYVQDTMGGHWDTITVDTTIFKNGTHSLESTTKNVIVSQRWQVPVTISYQWRSGRIGMYTSLNLLFTYYKFSSNVSQSGSDTNPVETPATPKNKMTIGIGGMYGLRYYFNQHFFLSGRVSYQSNLNAPMPKSTLSVQGGVGYEF